jgi:hypothetical protein
MNIFAFIAVAVLVWFIFKNFAELHYKNNKSAKIGNISCIII